VERRHVVVGLRLRRRVGGVGPAAVGACAGGGCGARALSARCVAARMSLRAFGGEG